MEKRKMILLTDHYPFGNGETFLENEISYLEEYFDLTIITSDTTSPLRRKTMPTVYRISAKTDLSFIRLIKYAICFFISEEGRIEIKEIIQEKDQILRRLCFSLVFFLKSQSFYYAASHIVEKEEYKDAIVYSYWANFKLLAFTHSKKWNMVITRMHGYDLYNERNPYNRQAFKSQIHSKLAYALFISEHGLNYYKKHFANDEKLLLLRLGTKKPACYPKKNSKFFRICSCSGIVPIKRVHYVVEALQRITDISIEWVCFGDGPQLELIKKESLKLPKNIRVAFMGEVPNEKVYEYYNNNYIDCFITTSEIEGCPVSIMEAMSYGIPVIATAVGGIPEMIEGTDNVLLSANPSTEDIISAIRKISQYNENEVLSVRKSNIELWHSMYNEKTNNERLISFLRKL